MVTTPASNIFPDESRPSLVVGGAQFMEEGRTKINWNAEMDALTTELNAAFDAINARLDAIENA